jgi:DNA-binding SARP family transcriptional activator
LAHLEIKLLGPFQVLIKGESAVGFDSDKVRALLAYLAVEADRPVRREKLAGLLWPDFSESSARTNLRQALANLRRVLADQKAEPPFLLPTHQTIQFNKSSSYTLDASSFTSLATADQKNALEAEVLEKAVALYQGEFLQGFSIPDAAAFEEWALVTRESLQRLALRVLHRLAGYYEEQAAYEQALRYAYRQLELDSYQEDAHQQIMRLLAHAGQRNEALAHYEDYRQLLQDELGVAPLEPTQTMYALLQAGDLPVLADFRQKLTAEGLPFPVPPGGTVTFLFTDIAGATRLLRGLGKQYGTLLVDQRRILRESFGRWNGYEVDTQGDSFFFAFPRATAAVAAAVEAQRGLAAHDWPEGVNVQVRMGLHTGEPWLGDEGYIGIDVHRAARIGQSGHGGQVLVSETTAALVIDEMPTGVQLLDLGRHILKDMPRPEHIRQLLIDDLSGEFPPLESLEALPPEIALPVEPKWMPSFLMDEVGEEPSPLFVGRSQQIGLLAEALSRALAGDGGFVFITGSSGRGKTTLMRAFANRALSAHPALQVSGGECNAYTSIGDPYLPFRQALNTLSGDLEPRWKAGALTREQARRLWSAFPLAARKLVDHGQDLIDVFVSGERLLTRAAMTVPDDIGLLQAIKHLARREPGTTGKLEQVALHEQYTQFMTAFVEQQPLLILLDDLQWADEASISLLFHLGRHLAGGRILILGAYRAEEVALGRSGRRHPLEKLLAEFKTLYGDIWIDLGETDPVEDRHFVQAFLETMPNRFSAMFQDSFSQHTGGHPFFTIELWRDLKARKGIIQDSEGYWVEGPALSWDKLPVRVEGIIEERMGRLDKELLDLLTIGAVEGEQFSAQVLARVLDRDEQEVINKLVDDLSVYHKLIVEQGPLSIHGKRIYRFKFRHVLFQQYLYAKLSPVKLERLHMKVGETLETLYPLDLEEIAPQLVWHFDQAKDDQRVIKYAFLAGERAWRLGASKEAIHFYNLSFEKVKKVYPTGAPVEAKIIQERLGDVYLENLSRHTEALAHYKNFLIQADPGEEKTRAQRKIADIYLLKGDLQQAQEFYSAALEGLDQDQENPDAGLIHASLAYLAIYKNNMEEAERAAQTALDISTRLGFSLGEAGAYNVLGHIDTYQGALEGAREHFEASLEIYRRTDDLPRTAKLHNNLGEITRLLGDMDQAQDHLREGLAIARRVGDKREEAATLTTSGEILLNQGRWSEAVPVLKEALQVAEESGVTVRLIEAQWFLGAAYLRLGEFQQARDYLIEAEKRCQDTEYVRFLPGVYLELARLESELDAYEAAERYIELAQNVAGKESGDEVLGQIQFTYGHLYAKRKVWETAIGYYQQALELMERAHSLVKTAEMQQALGLAYAGRAEPGDAQRARDQLTAAQEIFQQIAAEPYVSAIQGDLEKIKDS